MLKEKLQSLIEKSKSKVTPEIKAVMARSNELVSNSLTSRSILQVGDNLPEFELPDSKGTIVRSNEVTEENQLILTFFRGGW